MSAHSYFKGIGKNIMTPYPLGYWEVDDLLIELSEGTGMEGEPIFGVSVVVPDPAYQSGYAPDTEMSRLFWSKADALKRIMAIRGGQRVFTEEEVG